MQFYFSYLLFSREYTIMRGILYNYGLQTSLSPLGSVKSPNFFKCLHFVDFIGEFAWFRVLVSSKRQEHSLSRNLEFYQHLKENTQATSNDDAFLKMFGIPSSFM